MKKPSQIVSDVEIELVHGHANFGPTLTKRQVVDFGVLQYAFGYSSGDTQVAILLEHKLITTPQSRSHKAQLTRKGIEYLQSLFIYVTLEQVMALRLERTAQDDTARAVTAERERCAKLTEGFSAHQVCGGWGSRTDTDKNYKELAAAIRALT